MRRIAPVTTVAALFSLVAIGCENLDRPFGSCADVDSQDAETLGVRGLERVAGQYQPAPPGLVTVEFGGNTLECWPFTGESFSGEGSDPINLIFVGKADPRQIRSALMSLDGDRTGVGFPAEFPFNCVWRDAIGNVQAVYGEPDGWVGSAIQLECGDHNSVRFHLRLFRVGQWTVGSCHFELLIPGTTDHQVLSWELAEKLVCGDFLRSGLLDFSAPYAPTGQINPSPFRTIPAMIYNGVPVLLRKAIEGPEEDVSEDVPIKNDGYAMILNLAGSVPAQPGVWTQDFVIDFNQAIPRPFCAFGPEDWLYVQGPVEMSMTTRLTTDGVYISSFSARGLLSATPVSPPYFQPTGPTCDAAIMERNTSMITNRIASASGFRYRRLGTVADGEGSRFLSYLRVNSAGGDVYFADVWCASEELAPETAEADIIAQLDADTQAAAKR
ncbi:MAG: hypothetical protein OEW00_14245 [candidate division Zixibacteria bacterium]|nr:hypothetical protein [candidate division Zixibacteria bacterium]